MIITDNEQTHLASVTISANFCRSKFNLGKFLPKPSNTRSPAEGLKESFFAPDYAAPFFH